MASNMSILFIGCGRGEEIAAYDDDMSEILGLEPSKECRLDAQRRLSGRRNVTLLPDSVFDCTGRRFDRIYAVFPSPRMLLLREDAFATAVLHLLSDDGCFTLYSEIWPERGNAAMCLGCERLKQCFRQAGMRVQERIMNYPELPGFVRGSGFLSRAQPDTPLTFREVRVYGSDVPAYALTADDHR